MFEFDQDLVLRCFMKIKLLLLFYQFQQYQNSNQKYLHSILAQFQTIGQESQKKEKLGGNYGDNGN